MVLRVIFAAFAALVLVACGQAESGASQEPTPAGNPPATATAALPGSTPSPAGEQAAPTAAPASTPAPTDAPSGIVARAQAALAAALNVSPDTLTLVRVEEQEWSDSSLGCSSPNEAYMQVITPGQRIVFSDGNASYDIHTDVRGGSMLWCDGGRPVRLQ